MAHWGCKKMHQLGKFVHSSKNSRFFTTCSKVCRKNSVLVPVSFKGWGSNPNEKYLKVKWFCIYDLIILHPWVFCVCPFFVEKNLENNKTILVDSASSGSLMAWGDQLPKSQGVGRSFVGRPLGPKDEMFVFFPVKPVKRMDFPDFFDVGVICVWQFLAKT